jgi:hypothetical protein
MNVGELIKSANRLKREGKLDEAIAFCIQANSTANSILELPIQ